MDSQVTDRWAVWRSAGAALALLLALVIAGLAVLAAGFGGASALLTAQLFVAFGGLIVAAGVNVLNARGHSRVVRGLLIVCVLTNLAWGALLYAFSTQSYPPAPIVASPSPYTVPSPTTGAGGP